MFRNSKKVVILKLKIHNSKLCDLCANIRILTETATYIVGLQG